ncbi:Hypothetical protein, putative [Bodo saltans]|uniref:Uncharacterized protein n=1 Tax=Bodo saltans TaxID=75058 RepID=A0A0S4J2C9_BODSA|nr:Hypothetical protein, putative [Bodo saltans]|eukprot:CUG67280.1 Hypothetical protein, putative [Bodo saltans]
MSSTDESVQAAIAVLAAARATDPQDSLEKAVQTLTEYLSATSTAPVVAVAPKVAVALLQFSSVVPSLWELSVDPVLKIVLVSTALPWTARCLVAKKLPSTLDGQNSWPDAGVIKQRTSLVVKGLVAQAESVLSAGSNAPVQPQELRVVADSLSSVLAKNSFAVTIVASAIVGNVSVSRSVLPVVIAQRPPVGFFVAVENSLCALVGDGASRNIEDDLKLLPATYEGKGSAALRALATSIAADGEEASSSDVAAYSARVHNLLKDGDANPSALRLALSTVDVLAPIVRTWGASVRKQLCLSSSSSSPLPSSSQDDDLELLRRLTMLIVVSGIGHADTIHLLQDTIVEESLTGALVSHPTTTGDETTNVTTTFSPQTTNIAAMECLMIVGKKLLLTAKQGKATRKQAAASTLGDATTDAEVGQTDNSVARIGDLFSEFAGAASPSPRTSTVDVLAPIVRTWGASVRKQLCLSSSSSSPLPSSSQDDDLELLRRLTMLIVVSGIGHADTIHLLQDTIVEESLTGALVSHPTTTGDETTNVTTTFSPQTTNIAAMECLMIVGKKLLLAAKQGKATRKQVAPVDATTDAEVGQTNNSVARIGDLFSEFAGAAIPSLDLIIADIKVAEDILVRASSTQRNQRSQNNKNGKRGRDEEKVQSARQASAESPLSPEGASSNMHTVVDSSPNVAEAATASSQQPVQSVAELKAFLRTIIAVKDLSMFLALGVDHKVTPSWVAN